MIKADAGFTCFDDIKTIVSGNWGCGAFGGDIYAKLIIQWITATLAHKKLLYCPFNKKKLLEPIY
jgi:poly(ADP-ribose) glycohydrolase